MSNFVSLETALSGLRAQQARMSTISNNVANVDTPGYTREIVNLTNAEPYQSPVGWMGTGVDVTGITRARDAFLDARARSSSDAQAGFQTRADLLKNTESVLGEPSQGISTPLDALWSAFESAASNPADAGARTTVLNALGALTTRIQQVANGWTQQATQATQSLSQTVSDVNTKLSELASLNASIQAASTSGGANDLLDQRDQLLDQLASEAGATAVLSANGTARVVIGGDSVVQDTHVSPLTVNPNGTITALSGTPLTVGGKIGGYQSFLSSDLPAYQAQLNTFAQDLTTALNTQSAAGFSPDGQPGGPLLTYTPGAAAATITVAITDPNKLALASSAGPPFPVNDGTNAQAFADLQNSKTASGGTLTLDGAVQSLATKLGANVASTVSSAQNQQSLFSAVQAAQQATEGVSIDEEMTNMLEAQRAYEASSRVMTTVDQMLQVLVSQTGIVGR